LPDDLTRPIIVKSAWRSRREERPEEWSNKDQPAHLDCTAPKPTACDAVARGGRGVAEAPFDGTRIMMQPPLRPQALGVQQAAMLLVGAGAMLVAFLAGRLSGTLATSTSPAPDVPSNPRQAIFDELTAAETRAVARYVVAHLPGVKTSMFGGGADADYITGASAIELLPPAKAAALAFVDGKTSTRPPRFARVSVARGSRQDVMEFKVGPLHGCDANACDKAFVEPDSPLVPLLAPGQVSFEKRPMDMADSTWEPLLARVFRPLQPLLLASFGPVFPAPLMPARCGAHCHSGGNGTVFVFQFNDVLSTRSRRVSKLGFMWHRDRPGFQAMWLHPLPFSFRVAQVGTHLANWSVFDLFFCGQGPYASAEALLEAQPERCTYRPDPAREGQKGAWDTPGPDAAHARRAALAPPPPPAGMQRFRLSGAAGGNGRLVEWMGWSFFVTSRPSTGLAAMDVRFRGRRVAYELALSEAAAHYAGSGADQVFYLDSAYSLTQLGGDLAPGVDCPAHATFLNGVLWLEEHASSGAMDSDVSRARPYRALCIFEEDEHAPAWRHLTYASKSVDGVRASALVVRAATAVANYDYFTEFRFRLDGSIRVQLDLAGFMETRWFSQARTGWERPLGEVVHRGLFSPLHSHFALFKVDLDAGERGESLEKTTITASMKEGIPELRGLATKHAAREYIEKEGAGASTLVPSSVEPSSFAIVDRASGSVPLGDATPTAPPGYVSRLLFTYDLGELYL
jgi:hypothetical protein